LRQGIEDSVITEIALFHRQSQGGECPVGHRNLLHFGSDNLKDAGFEDHFRIGCMNLGKLLLGPFKILQQIGLATPQTDAAPDVLCAGVAEHANVVVEIASAVEQALHRNGPRQIVVQHLARDDAVKFIAAPVLPW
jgi:type III secretion system FlhB-like substrate exporter